MATADYTSDDPLDRLAAVRLAISKVLASQEYDVRNGRRNRRADLKDLRDSERQIMDEIENQGTNSQTQLAFQTR